MPRHFASSPGWLTLACVTAACLSGCAVIPEYPSQLPPLVPTAEKTGQNRPPLDRLLAPHTYESLELGGRYLNKGTATSPNGRELGTLFFSDIIYEDDPQTAANLKNADAFVVTQPAKGLVRVEFRQGSRLLGTWLKTGDATYGRGFMELPRHPEETAAGSVGFIVENDRFWIRKAVDGSLIVLHRAGTVGLIVVVPFAKMEHNAWYRFLPAVEEERRDPR